MHANKTGQLMLACLYAVSSFCLGRLMFFSIMKTGRGPLMFLPFSLKNEVTNSVEQLLLSSFLSNSCES